MLWRPQSILSGIAWGAFATLSRHGDIDCCVGKGPYACIVHRRRLEALHKRQIEDARKFQADRAQRNRYRVPAQRFVYCSVHLRACNCVGSIRDVLHCTAIPTLTTHELDSHADNGNDASGLRGNGEKWREGSMTWSLHIVPARAFQNSGDAALCHVVLITRLMDREVHPPASDGRVCPLVTADGNKRDFPAPISNLSRSTAAPPTLATLTSLRMPSRGLLTMAATLKRDGPTLQQPLAI
jgi:hypothetical protein